MILILPYPPSVNNLYATFRGRRILSREGRAYHANVAAAVLEQKATGFEKGERLRYVLNVSPPDKRKRDLSNVLKAIEDALTKARIWADDSDVDSLSVYRHSPVKGGAVTINIFTHEGLA